MAVTDAFNAAIPESEIIAGVEARGFIFAAAIAAKFNKGFVPFRKSGKLPYLTHGASYGLEYGNDRLEVHVDAFTFSKSVVIIDDVLATGGTICAAIELAQSCGASVSAVAVLLEIAGLNGLAKITEKYPDIKVVVLEHL